MLEASLEYPPTACLDWVERLKRCEVPINVDALPVDTAEARRFGEIFDRLRVADVAGQPKTVDLPNMAWVKTIGQALWGSSAIRQALVCTAKKQSKTSSGSLLFGTAFLGDKLPGQQYTILAPSKDIADKAFQAIWGAIKADAYLSGKIYPREYVRELEKLETGTKLNVIAYDKSAATGLKGSVLVDESWLLGEKPTAQSTRAQIRGALLSSPYAKILQISTTSDDIPRGAWADLISYARKVRDGLILDASFLPAIWEPWEGCPDPFEDESVWPMLLPSFPHISGPEDYRGIISEAKNAGPSAIIRDKAQFFNLSPGMHAVGDKGWKVARMAHHVSGPLTIDDLIERSQQIAAGVDLGSLDDLSSLTFLGEDKTGRWLVAGHSWATQSAWEYNKPSASLFDDFVDQGELTKCEPGEDIGGIFALLEAARATGRLRGIGIDPAGAADLAEAFEESPGYQLVTDPKDVGWSGDVPVLGVGQTAFKLMPALRTIERKVEQRKILLSSSPLLQWSLSSAVMRRAGAAEAIERASPERKIDPVAALLDATTVFLAIPPKKKFDPLSLIG